MGGGLSSGESLSDRLESVFFKVSAVREEGVMVKTAPTASASLFSVIIGLLQCRLSLDLS